MTRISPFFLGHCIVAISFFAVHVAHAGAWTQKAGAKQLIITASVYEASRYFDAQEKSQTQLPYYKSELAGYGEYGLVDDVTLGGQLRFVRASQNNTSAINLGDSEFFARKRVWKDDLSVVSLQPGIALPSPDTKRTTPKIGGDHASYSLRTSYGRNFKARGKWHYADITGGYVHRAGKPGDQLALDATVGFNIDERWQILPQFFLTKSRHAVQASTFTESSADDYDLAKAQLSMQYSFRQSGAVQLGAFTHLWGKNTGQGKGLLVSYVRNFP